MIRGGTQPHKDDRRDFDFFKNHESFGATILPSVIDNDAHLWMPDQNTYEPIFGNDAEPYGCTNYSQNDHAADRLGILFNPAYTESITHANEKGGLDMRVSFQAVIDHGVQTKEGRIVFPFKAYYNVKAQGGMDWFTAFRACMAITKGRSVSIGIPWFAYFENSVVQNADGTFTIGALPDDWNAILPMPPSLKTFNVPWHNAVIARTTDRNTKGEMLRGGEIFLAVKSMQGERYGDKGWCYMDQKLANALFNIPYTIALVGSPTKLDNVATIDMSWLKNITSLIGYFAHMNVALLLSFLPKRWTL